MKVGYGKTGLRNKNILAGKGFVYFNRRAGCGIVLKFAAGCGTGTEKSPVHGELLPAPALTTNKMRLSIRSLEHRKSFSFRKVFDLFPSCISNNSDHVKIIFRFRTP